ncbi:MAG: fibrillarin-like rRNA/tRNA 2'-O-methyltransferase [Candidatus Diapherotrites archaeon]|uniref:Fibrillarin-like rRNA/tRNA 2'-O-methyltransferase n=1 Tax=Candidatus Iainarchaeum sp. TaxID=3101447 RepID=A0A8T4C753_9ARCH|nr:fibrillarin-like rRNA/tRNA 2'-O-methyltransferase [Candidatus Diapherotrites archaeon]
MSSFLRKDGKNYFTRSFVNGQRVYGERIVTEGKIEWREWNPYRSKLAAALCSGLLDFPIREGSAVLYLGSAEGTSISHVSDVIGEKGVVVGVDISPKAMATFSKLVESRSNIIPLLADANQPSLLRNELGDFSCDVLVQDVSQRNQADIFVKNLREFGKKNAHGLLVIKARSVDSSISPKKVLENELALVKRSFSVLQVVDLNAFESDHFLIHVVVGEK